MDTIGWLVVLFIIAALVVGIYYLWWKLYPQNVGIKLNKWLFPVKVFSMTDDLQKRLQLLDCGGDLYISKKHWNTIISVVVFIFWITRLQEIQSEAQEYEDVGIKLNKWQFPVKEFSMTDDYLQKRLQLLNYGRDLDISKKDWNTTITLVDESLETLLQEMRSEAQEYEDIGIKRNKWQFPVKEFSTTDDYLQKRLQLLDCGGDLDISKKDWNTTISVVDEILETLLQEMRSEAKEYEGLVLKGYIKQGSAREGLKIQAPDEFDVLLEYRIEGLSFEAEPLIDFGISYPGLGKMKILTAPCKVKKNFKTWLAKGVIVMHNSSYYLNARILHQSIFESIIDKCRRKITNITKQNLPVHLMRNMNPPSINIRIERQVMNSRQWRRFVNWVLQKPNIPEAIDIDIVPAMVIGMEKAKGPRKFMDCPRYAVVKWMDERQQAASRFESPAMIWRFCTSGYEKHYMDLARKHNGKRYIMTACRIIKMLINMEKEKPRSGYQPLAISLFLRSYYLKNIAFYCMLFRESVEGVHEALGYFLGFLKMCLIEENLPQFFTGNKNLTEEFPACAKGGQINLFKDVPQGTFIQARSSLDSILNQLIGMYDTEAFRSITRWEFLKLVKPIQNQACSVV